MSAKMPYSYYQYPFNLMLEVADLSFLFDMLEKSLATLTPKEQRVIRERYENQYTYEEIAHLMGITRERVRQIDKSALRKLKSPIRFGKIDKLKVYIEDTNIDSSNRILSSYDNGVSVRLYNCLARADLLCVDDIIKVLKEPHPGELNHLTKVRNLGRKTYVEAIKICEKMKNIDLSAYYNPYFESGKGETL